MRPVGTRQSALRAPFNFILGTEVNVRLLRELTGTERPLSASHLARRTGVSPQAAYDALRNLTEAGVVERPGGGGRGPFHVRKEHPLTAALRSLFDAERQRFEDLRDSLTDAARRLAPPPRAVLLHGPVATRTDRPGDPLRLALVASASHVSLVAQQFREHLQAVAERYDVAVEVQEFTDADLRAIAPALREELLNAELVYGTPPAALFPETAPMDRDGPHTGQRAHDERLLRIGAAVARRLADDPDAIDRARRHIRKRLRLASAGERKELSEWDRILRSASIPALRRLLTDPGPRATRLRQSLPFLDVLSPAERTALPGRTRE